MVLHSTFDDLVQAGSLREGDSASTGNERIPSSL